MADTVTGAENGVPAGDTRSNLERVRCWGGTRTGSPRAGASRRAGGVRLRLIGGYVDGLAMRATWEGC